jgi:prepilin-type processing-associated H-X9-DG protein
MSWRVRLLPFIEQRPLHALVKYEQPWDGEANIALLRRMPRIFAVPPTKGGTQTSYLVFTSPEPVQVGSLQGTPMFGNGTARGYGTADFSSVVDGTANTIMVVEANPDLSVPWMKPADLPLDPNNPKAGIGRLRPGGFNVVMGDGSVKFIPNSIKHSLS